MTTRMLSSNTSSQAPISGSRSVLPQSSQQKKNNRLQLAYFKEVLSETGVVLGYDDSSHCITQEQSLVARDIYKKLTSHITYPSNVTEFINGLEVLCQKEAHFHKALLPCELKKSGVNNDPAIKQWSLIKILLSVSPLQNGVINILLRQAALVVGDTDEEDPGKLPMLLNALCYLPYVTDTAALVTGVLGLLDAASNFSIKCVILNLIPEIIPDCESEKTAKHLSRLLEDNIELSGAIVDCLNALSLSTDLTNDIQQQILSLFQTTDITKTFSVLFEFLITNTKNLQEVLITSRGILNNIFESDEDDHKVLIFTRLATILYNQKTVYEGWFNLLSNIRLVTDFKPVDLVLLFILHSVNTSRKRLVETLIKKRITHGSMKLDLLEKVFKFMSAQILKDCLESIVQVADFLLKSYNSELASEMYRMLFNHKLIGKIERQDIIHNLLNQISSDSKGGSLILKILLMFLSDDFIKLRQHSAQLMGLLEKLDCVDLRNVKDIFEILCSLTCGEKADESMSGLGDELHMIIRKNLNSAKKFVQSCGIVAAVAMVKTLVTTTEEQQSETSLEDTLAITDLQDTNIQNAAVLLQTVNTYTVGTTDFCGLYYDQLAIMLITSTNLNNQFLAWLYNIVTNDFQTMFVTENIPDRINDIQVSLQYSLNATGETQIAINIAELCLNSRNNNIITLAPRLRLLQLVHFHQHLGDLSSIDALLGCGVVMPILDDLDNYDTLQLKQVADCVFHCINWFRELISAFVKQKSRKLRNKVLERITGVVELEELLNKCMSSIPDHCLPQSYFDHMSQTSSKRHHSPSKSGKPVRPKKKPKSAEIITEHMDETSTSTAPPVTQTKITTKKNKPIKNLKFEFREVVTDIILLFKYPIKFDALDTSITSQVTTLNVVQLKFLLEEFVCKLSGNSNSNINLAKLMKDSINLIPAIQKHLNAITLHLDGILKDTGGVSNSEQLFTSEANHLKVIFSLIMKVYSLIFGWSGFQNAKNNSLLRESLYALRSAEHQSQVVSTKALIAEATKKFLVHANHCIYLPAAVNLIKIIQAFNTLQREPQVESKKEIAALAGKLLKKNWYNLKGDRETGKDTHVNIDILIKAYLSGANVRIINGLVNTLREQVTELNNKDDKLEMLCSIDKASFYLFYRCLCVTLLDTIKIEVTGLTNNQHLNLWRTVAITMEVLMKIVKIQETRTNLISLLKNSVGILKVFLLNGIPILEIMLRSKPDEVVEIFRILQQSTRFLHNLCCYSKYTKDTSLVAFVPQFRLTLESLIYRVKAALVANGCADAFWMGNLRNRDLHGEDILSQSTIQTDETRDAEEELPSDDGEDEAADDVSLLESESTASDIC